MGVGVFHQGNLRCGDINPRLGTGAHYTIDTTRCNVFHILFEQEAN